MSRPLLPESPVTPAPIGTLPLSELLTPNEAAKALKVHVSSVRKLMDNRQLPYHTVNGSIRLLKRDIAAYVAANRVEAVDAKKLWQSED